MMRAFPVRTLVMMEMVMSTAWIRPFVPVLTVVTLIHWFNAFLSSVFAMPQVS
jgi:hypothetical protein